MAKPGGSRLDHGNLYTLTTLKLLVNQPGTQLLIGVFFVMRGLQKAMDAARKLAANGAVPFNKGNNMGAAMYCALNVAVVLFITVLWLSGIAELLALSPATQAYSAAYTLLTPPMVACEVGLLAYVYRGLWKSVLHNNHEPTWRENFRVFRTKVKTFHDYVDKRGVDLGEFVLLPLGATGLLTANFWIHLLS